MVPSTERVFLKHLDCASCAAKIEAGINRIDGVHEASVDFATLTLHVNATDIQAVLDEVKRIDPHVEPILRPAGPAPAATDPGTYRLKREVVVLVGASALFSAVLAFEGLMGRPEPTPWVLVIAAAAYLLAGWNVIAGAFRTLRRGGFADENVLMVIATVGAMAIGAVSEAVGVMIFYKVGELLQELAVSRSRRSIRALLAARPDKAFVKVNGTLVQTAPEDVRVGDLLLVKPGEKIPLDGEVIDGTSQVDTSPLTGEPIPKSVKPGDTVMAGVINLASSLTVRVSMPFERSSISRVLHMVENAAARKAATEKFITIFARYYTPAVVALAAVIAVFPPLFVDGAAFSEWIYRALVILVISCPCALVVSIPLGYFGGIGRASRQGILVKGSNYIDALAQVDTVVFDKTGTLTRGVFEVDTIAPVNGFSADMLLTFAAAAELHSSHPIAASILRAAAARNLSVDADRVGPHQAMGGVGVRAQYDGRRVLVGNDALLHQQGVFHDRCAFDQTVAHVVVDDSYAGFILMGDHLKPDSEKAVTRLRRIGVKRQMMLTGDNECAAAKVAASLGLDGFHAGLLPEEKVSRLEAIMAAHQNRGKVAYVGDGINDAPVLARADVGVAMGALGSEAAIETADVVLMTDSPSKMAEALTIGRETRRVVWQNIVLALAVKGIFVAFGAFGLASMWEAVFADMGTALLAVFNSTRALGHSAS
ncbi:MAG: heavy metal translocating P-type ATPase [Desulfobacterales bacterium]|jgi:Cd2+/Zn2+-exporting ATPase